MKTMGLLLMAGLLAGIAQAQTVSIIQITDMRGQSEYSVMNRDEFAALQKEIMDEAKVYPAAAAEAKKEWDADKTNKLPFQGNRIKPRSAKQMGAAFGERDREKADKKKVAMEERFQEKQLEEQDKEKGKKLSDADVAKVAAREKAFDDAFAAISKKMGDKLGRPVPQVGLVFNDPKAKPEEKK